MWRKKINQDQIRSPQTITDFLNNGGDKESAYVLEQYLDASYRITNVHGYQIDEPRARLSYLIQRKRRMTLERWAVVAGGVFALWSAVWQVITYYWPPIPQPQTSPHSISQNRQSTTNQATITGNGLSPNIQLLPQTPPTQSASTNTNSQNDVTPHPATTNSARPPSAAP